MSITYYLRPDVYRGPGHSWAIEELGVPCERVKVDIQKKETKTEAFLKLNPNGVVPLLVVDGLPIFESTAILLYLGETYGVEKGFTLPARVSSAPRRSVGSSGRTSGSSTR